MSQSFFVSSFIDLIQLIAFCQIFPGMLLGYIWW